MRSGRFPLLLALFLESSFAQPRVLGGTPTVVAELAQQIADDPPEVKRMESL
jgi:hypothetical protein